MEKPCSRCQKQTEELYPVEFLPEHLFCRQCRDLELDIAEALIEFHQENED